MQKNSQLQALQTLEAECFFIAGISLQALLSLTYRFGKVGLCNNQIR